MDDDDAGGGAGDADAAVELTAIEGKQLDRVVAAGAVGRQGVDRAIADATAERSREIDQHATGRKVGAAEIVDHDVIGAAEGVEIDPLNAVDIHGNAGDVVEETHASAVGRTVDVLVDMRTAEHKRVEAGPTLDRVVAVARIPLEYVVAGTEEGGVVALIAVDEIVPVAAEKSIGAVA